MFRNNNTIHIGDTMMRFWDHVMVWSDAFMVMSALVLVWTFFTAFTHGFVTVVTINDYHEAYVELVVFVLAIPLLLLRGWYELRRYNDHKLVDELYAKA